MDRRSPRGQGEQNALSIGGSAITVAAAGDGIAVRKNRQDS
jgi:hypothetical protein